MSPKLIRLMFVATVVAGFSAPMLVASAAGQPRTVDAWNPPRNFEVPGAADSRQLDINKDDTVSWVIWEGEHTVTPKNAKQWGDPGSDVDHPLKPEDPRYSKTFKTPGDYIYFCSIHGGIDEEEKPFGMWGRIHVIDTTPNTTPATTPATTPPTSPPATTGTTATTRPGATPPATTATAPTVTTRPGPSAPATTATTAKGDKKPKDPKEESTTTSSTLPPPVDLPNEAIVPTLPGSDAAPGSDAEAPIDTPEGEAVALLKPKKDNGGDAVKLLIVSGIGLGALGVGAGGYKYANRSSKYFPA